MINEMAFHSCCDCRPWWALSSLFSFGHVSTSTHKTTPMSSANVTEHPCHALDTGRLRIPVNSCDRRAHRPWRWPKDELLQHAGWKIAAIALVASQPPYFSRPTIGSASSVPDAPLPLLRPFVDNLTHDFKQGRACCKDRGRIKASKIA